MLHETKEELAAVPGPTAVEAERELVEVGVQMRPTHPPVMGPKQPTLEQRDDPVDPWEQLGGQGVVSPQVRHTVVIPAAFLRHGAIPDPRDLDGRGGRTASVDSLAEPVLRRRA